MQFGMTGEHRSVHVLEVHWSEEPEPGARNAPPMKTVRLAAFYGQEAVAWVFVYGETFWKIGTFWAFVFAEVVNALYFTTAQSNLF
jgi:hypothetical protein